MNCKIADMKASRPLSVHILVLLVLASLASTACAPEQSAVRDDFGNSVRAMIANQTYSSGNEVDNLDGGKAVNAMGEYRNSVAKPKEVKQNIILNVGK